MPLQQQHSLVARMAIHRARREVLACRSQRVPQRQQRRRAEGRRSTGPRDRQSSDFHCRRRLASGRAGDGARRIHLAGYGDERRLPALPASFPQSPRVRGFPRRLLRPTAVLGPGRMKRKRCRRTRRRGIGSRTRTHSRRGIARRKKSREPKLAGPDFTPGRRGLLSAENDQKAKRAPTVGAMLLLW